MLQYVSTHLTEIVAIQQSLFAALAALAQLVGWTKASKVFGTLTTLDLGRVVRVLAALKSK